MSQPLVLISPFSSKRRNGKPNAKNYPWWPEVVKGLRAAGVRTVQIGVEGEEEIGADDRKVGLSFDQLRQLLDAVDGWVAVDNFFPHFAAYHGRGGVAIFAVSDPNLFGHTINTNLLKDRKFLRRDQYNNWQEIELNADAFIPPQEVVQKVLSRLPSSLAA
jgi:ADP-heptose:LPS heptosyltransferase